MKAILPIKPFAIRPRFDPDSNKQKRPLRGKHSRSSAQFRCHLFFAITDLDSLNFVTKHCSRKLSNIANAVISRSVRATMIVNSFMRV